MYFPKQKKNVSPAVISWFCRAIVPNQYIFIYMYTYQCIYIYIYILINVKLFSRAQAQTSPSHTSYLKPIQNQQKEVRMGTTVSFWTHLPRDKNFISGKWILWESHGWPLILINMTLKFLQLIFILKNENEVKILLTKMQCQEVIFNNK